MDKQWVEKKTAEHKKKIEAEKAKLYEKVNACELIPEKAKKKLLKEIDRYEEEPYGTIHTFMIVLLKSMRDVDVEIEWFDDFINKELKLDNYIMLHRYRYFGHLLDSEPVEFDGDLLITDPCYFMKERDESTAPNFDDFMTHDYSNMSNKKLADSAYREDVRRYREAREKWDEENPRDWDVCDCGYSMEKLGFFHSMNRGTLYGDWGCTTYNSDTKEPIGHFTADAGQVGVFLLSELYNYNPEYADELETIEKNEKLYCTTILRDFKGTVQFVVEEEIPDKEYGVHVVGRGINKKTGKPFNFITSQTSL